MFILEAEKHTGNAPPYRAKDMAFRYTWSKDSPRAIQKKMDLERSNALQKALKTNFQLLKGGTSLGEDVEGLTLDLRV